MWYAAEGLSNKEIARRLNITEGTAKVHLHRIFQKTGTKNRTALARFVHAGSKRGCIAQS
jgi:two-component system nitrate/nitrite response regulator NarL